MNNIAININGFMLKNETSNTMNVNIFIDNTFMLSQMLKPGQNSTPIIFDSSEECPITGNLQFKVTDLNTGVTYPVSSPNKLLYDDSSISIPMELCISKVNDIYVINYEFIPVSRISYRNDAFVLSKFLVISEERGTIARTALIAIRQSRTVDLSELGLLTGEELLSVAVPSGGVGKVCPSIAEYHPDSPFTAIFTLTGSLFGLTFTREL